MSEVGVETGKGVGREAICPNCKGKGTSFEIKLKAWLGVVEAALGGLVIIIFTDGGILRFIGIAALLTSVVLLYRAPGAKCKRCGGTGKVKLGTCFNEERSESHDEIIGDDR